PTTAIPPPPVPPLQPVCRLSAIVLLSIAGEPNRIEIPAPLHAWLLTITFPRMDGDALAILTPPPSPKPGVSKPDRPLRMVNPSRREPGPPPDANITTESAALPSRTETAGPATLRTVMALPLKSMFSTYVPGHTRTVSPSAAALMAAATVANVGVE